MTLPLFVYLLAIPLSVVGALISVYAFLYHRRDFRKIREWESMRKEGKTLDALRSDMEQTKARLTGLAGELDQAETAIRDADVARKFLEEHPRLKADQTALHEGLAMAGEKVRVASEELGGLHQQKTLLLGQIADFEGKHKHLLALRDEEEKLRPAVEKLKDEEKRLAQSVEELNASLERTREDVEQAKQLIAEIGGLEEKKKGLESSVKILQETHKQLSKVVEASGPGSYAERYQDLWRPVEFSDLPPAPEPVGEQEAFDRMKGYLERLKLKFPDRVLHAFHTALKVNEISPITVLAGISGTGKSLLPRRYAEGMGMHFVSLAVQPRWDSPQDLFGFYNYLEKRYKATELARAMVQFERFNRVQTPWDLPKEWDHGLEDRMLLVLLDEMNLARIEYYFSDFLSKLEIRRDILHPERSEKRAKAEIALEMGSLSAGEKAIRLFPGQNVLFTGTMNEDETTQTLSDKVLDRSCVLRFGRPANIEKYDQPDEVEGVPEGLPLEVWTSWIRKPHVLQGDDVDEINDWISKLLDAMEDLGRPFGHRVILAIQTYIANYPRWVPDWKHKAMADQIEQRIMPKVRGVDIDVARIALDKIRETIRHLGDRKLEEAFRKGREDHAVFQWQGLDRADEDG